MDRKTIDEGDELARLRREVELLRAVADAAAPLRLGRDMRGVALTWGSPVQRRIEAALRALDELRCKGR